MKLKILSHAGFAVSAAGKTVVCDPWLFGSTYWRSWWNYPPPSPELLDSLKPDCIYITHIHWDHFAGPSLRRFGKDIPIVIPAEPAGRMARDLKRMSFTRIIELPHGKTYEVDAALRLTSYQFFVFTDSAVVIEADNTVVLNANDAKLMGGPLKQILERHPKIDFVLRSHSSANSRACYEVVDSSTTVMPDNREEYIEAFADFVRATGARYAIPFASNHCHLHREVFEFNDYIVTPVEVAEYFSEQGISKPELKVMVSGDSWSDESGFHIQAQDYFTNRPQRLREYKEAVSEKLEKTYRREALAQIDLERVKTYFEAVFRSMPFLLRWQFRKNPVLYILGADKRTTLLEVDFFRKTVREIDSCSDKSHPLQIRTQVALFNHCMAANLFSHLAISKRVRYRVTTNTYGLSRKLSFFYNLYEYDLLPLRRIRPVRFVGRWARRWREILLYARVIGDLCLGRRFEYRRYLPLPRLK